MNEYQLGLALVTELDESQKGLDERVEFIKSQIKIFNEKSLRSVFNPKHIGLGENDEKDIQLTRTTLVVTLYSQEALITPGKAMRLLSQLLVTSDNPDNLSDLVWNKKLFRTFKVATAEDGGSQNIIDLSGISDAELIKALIDFVCDEKDFSGEKRSAMDQMKKLAVECGLLRKETL